MWQDSPREISLRKISSAVNPPACVRIVCLTFPYSDIHTPICQIQLYCVSYI